MTEVDEKPQLTTPHIHRVNTTKQAIHTWKNHFTERMGSIELNLLLYLC